MKSNVQIIAHMKDWSFEMFQCFHIMFFPNYSSQFNELFHFRLQQNSLSTWCCHPIIHRRDGVFRLPSFPHPLKKKTKMMVTLVKQFQWSFIRIQIYFQKLRFLFQCPFVHCDPFCLCSFFSPNKAPPSPEQFDFPVMLNKVVVCFRCSAKKTARGWCPHNSDGVS